MVQSGGRTLLAPGTPTGLRLETPPTREAVAAEEQRLPCATGVFGECQLCSHLGEVLCDYTELSGLARPKPILSDLAHSSSFLCLQILLINSQSALLYAGYCSEY